MPRTKGSKTRPPEVRQADKAAAIQRRAIRKAHDFRVRGRLPGGVNFEEAIRYTAFKTPKPAFDEATAAPVA